MKRKISALFVMSLFVLSLAPATLAQTVNSDLDVMVGKNIAVATATVKEGRIIHADARARHMSLRAAASARDRSAIKADVIALRDHKGDFNTNDHKRAITIVQHAMNTIETMSIHFERLKEHIASSPEFQKTHPNAVVRIEGALDDLGAWYATLSEVISDDEVTGEEWRAAVLPILKKIKPKADTLRNNEDFKDIRGQRVKEFVHRLKEEVAPKVRARLESRQNVDVDARMARYNVALEGFESLSVEQQRVRLQEIREVMA